MEKITSLLKATLLAATISASATGIALAGSPASGTVMKPLQGIAFAAGPKHAVGYFYPKENRCKLVVTVADTPNGAGETFDALRHEANIGPGDFDQFNLSSGETLEFNCSTDARTMVIKSVVNIAAGTVK
ncbi:hypothetical protein [Hyphomicrobium facile]|uniref:Uncharacterized protein n=1 Tax=Hyphomicrobium facile TaxID=51670 RepID=A0A1I7NQB2_9HYPH|nr:hypothetical protein [Hyphomicrobium facile]SFV36822.1 hypothetical protein SAMN04488557_2805 [Hyphomicrobium facile]